MAKEQDVYRAGESFEKVDFVGQILPVGEYEGCRFVNCNFENVNLSSIKFIECEFVGCNLSLVPVTNTAFGDVIFKDSKMLGIHFEHCSAFGFAVRFENCALEHSSFYQVKLKSTLFIDSKLGEVDFTEAVLANSVFENCDLLNAKFEHTNLENVDFRTSYNFSIDPELNALAKAKFSRDSLAGLLYRYGIEIS